MVTESDVGDESQWTDAQRNHESDELTGQTRQGSTVGEEEGEGWANEGRGKGKREEDTHTQIYTN